MNVWSEYSKAEIDSMHGIEPHPSDYEDEDCDISICEEEIIEEDL